MYLPCRLRRLRSLCYRPGSDFRFPGGQVGNQIQQRIRGFYQLIQSGFFDSPGLSKFLFLLAIQFRDFRFQLRGDDDHFGPLTVCKPAYLLHIFVIFRRRVVLGYVGYIYNRLIREEIERLDIVLLLFFQLQCSLADRPCASVSLIRFSRSRSFCRLLSP